MNRSTIVLSATAAGLAATLGFNVHKPSTAATTSAAVTTTSSSSSSGGASSSSSSSSGSSSSSSSSSSTKTVTSDAVSTQYGNVQLKVTISNGKITNIQALQLPSNDPKSTQIGQYAEPLLRQSALSKQSADIDFVSGATFTSQGYQTALQSALDKAGFSTSSSATA